MARVISTRIRHLAVASSFLLLLILHRAHSTCLSPVIHSYGNQTYTTLINETQFESRDHLVFWANATTAVGIGLAETTNPATLIFKVVFGAQSNNKTYIRLCHNDDDDSVCKVMVELSPHSPHNGQDYVPFWIQWADSKILAGSGGTAGTNQTIGYKNDYDFKIGAILFGGFGNNPYTVQFDDDSYCTKNQSKVTTVEATENITSATEISTEIGDIATAITESSTEITTHETNERTTETKASDTDMPTETSEGATEAPESASEVSSETSERGNETRESITEMSIEIATKTSVRVTETKVSDTEISTETTDKATENGASDIDMSTEKSEGATATSESTAAVSAETSEVATESPADLHDNSHQTQLTTNEVNSEISTETTEVTPSMTIETDTEVTKHISTETSESDTDSKATKSTSQMYANISRSTESTRSNFEPSIDTSDIATKTDSDTLGTSTETPASPTNSVYVTSPTRSVSEINPTSGTGSVSEINPTSGTGSVFEISKTSPTTSTGTLELPPEQQPCACVPVDPVDRDPAVLEQEQQEMAAAIVRELQVPSRNVSSYTRTKTSARDDRDSSAVMGLVGIVVCCVPLAFVVLMDLCGALGRVHT